VSITYLLFGDVTQRRFVVFITDFFGQRFPG